MNTTRLHYAAALLILCLRAPALPLQECPGLAEGLELPAAVKLISAHGYVASTASGDAPVAADDGAYAAWRSEAASLVLEVQGPRTVRLYAASGAPDLNAGAYLWLRVDGRLERLFNTSLPPATDVTVPAGAHHVELVSAAVEVVLYRVTDLTPGLPVLTQPDLVLPVADPVSLRLPVESDSPVTWSAEGLPDGLTLDSATGRLTGLASGLMVNEAPKSAWITMTNAHGSQSEHVRIWGMNGALAARHERRRDRNPSVMSVPAQPLATPPVEAHLELPVSPDDGGPSGDVVTTVTGPNTLHFRSRGSRRLPGPVVVRVDGAEVLRRYARTTADDEMSVEIPPGEHEVVWQFPVGGTLDRIRPDSDPIPQVLGPRLLGPFTLTARPGLAFAFDLEAASPFGPGRFYAAPPPGVELNQDTGLLSGALPAGDYWIHVQVRQSDEEDTAFYHLQVREDAAAVLNTPGLTWLQSTGPQAWHAAAESEGGRVVWTFQGSSTKPGEVSRMETIIEGPDMVHLEAVLLSSATTVALEVDGLEYSTELYRSEQRTGPYVLNVPIPPGRHVLALKALRQASGEARVQILRLLRTSAGAPVFPVPEFIESDGGEPLRIVLTAAGGGTFAVTGLPDTMSFAGNIIEGELNPGYPNSEISVTRDGITTSAPLTFLINDINRTIGSAGWYAYRDRFTAAGPYPGDAWDGISSLAFTQESDWNGRNGHHEGGIAKTLTGPDTLTFRRKSAIPAMLDVKVDGTLVHQERVSTTAWGTVEVAIPAGEHHVSIGTRPARPEGAGSPDNIEYSNFLLDDVRLESELRPDITDTRRRLEVLEGGNFSFTPQAERKVREWSVEGLPEGITFDSTTGTISASPLNAMPAEYPLTFTAQNLRGTDSFKLVLAVAAVPALGDSPKLRLQKDGWFLEPEFADPVPALDQGDVHYSRDNNLGIMSAWVDGPDTMQFWWKYNHGDTFFYVEIDGRKVYVPDTYVFGYWERVEIPIPAGRHLVRWFGYDNVTVDHITLASDGVPQLRTQRDYEVDAAGFSLRLTAANGPVMWTCEEFPISSSGVIAGSFDAEEIITVHVSATNAAGTGYAEFRLRGRTPFNTVLESRLNWTPGGAWLPETSGQGSAPADGEDFLHRPAGASGPLAVEIPTGGGVLALWAKATGPDRAVTVQGDPAYYWHPAFTFYLPDADWHRVLIPLHRESVTLLLDGQSELYLDRAELLHPGDPLIDLCPLPTALPGVPYTGQLRLLAGGPVTWNVTGLPDGLTIDSATGSITGTPLAGLPSRSELRITATAADGRSTFAWMLLESLTALAEALDTHTLVWSVQRSGPVTGWQPGVVPDIPPEDTHPSHDGVDYVSCFAAYDGRTTLSTTVTGPGRLSFWWSVPHAERPQFFVNGVLKATAPHDEALVPQRYALTLPAGTHVLSWVSANVVGSEFGIGFLDRVLWSGDAVPLFTGDTFDLEIEPGSEFSYRIPTNGAPVFRGEDVPDWLTLHPATGLLSGTAPGGLNSASFTVIITQDGREDRALFNVHTRPTAAAALDTPAGVWQRYSSSRWQTVSDPGVLRPGGGGSVLALGDNGFGFGSESLLLFVDGPCFVTFWSRHDGPGSVWVRPHHLAPAAMYERHAINGAWQRGIVAVPAGGRQTVTFETSTSGTLYLDTVQVFPWEGDANGDGLPNAIEVALARWPDAPPAGDPVLTLTPHPDSAGLARFGMEYPSGSPFDSTRDHAMRLQPEVSTSLSHWQPAQVTESVPGPSGRLWKILPPAAGRSFLRVTARPRPQ